MSSKVNNRRTRPSREIYRPPKSRPLPKTFEESESSEVEIKTTVVIKSKATKEELGEQVRKLFFLRLSIPTFVNSVLNYI